MSLQELSFLFLVVGLFVGTQHRTCACMNDIGPSAWPFSYYLIL